ncbi:hypothetical protein LMG31506_03027 [Cupriavidus yeoncheonensis]|uniref:Uncharacterized protein n=2 Tax=Cupriavidus yeoncheonensis TaxID=1462994 RepID=A0A916ITC4_9BURK|nr:hypothetical protein LMG31506_03027 [Cupriavidus yeoncheonensis]
MEFHAQRELYSNRIALHIAEHPGDGAVVIAKPLVMERMDPGQMTEPCMRLTTNEAQSLMDELWHAGLRPSEGTGSAGAMAATQKHLEDMRTLVFNSHKP